MISAVPIGVTISSFDPERGFFELPTIVPSLRRSWHFDIAGSMESLVHPSVVGSVVEWGGFFCGSISASCVRKNVPSVTTKLQGS